MLITGQTSLNPDTTRGRQAKMGNKEAMKADQDAKQTPILMNPSCRCYEGATATPMAKKDKNDAKKLTKRAKMCYKVLQEWVMDNPELLTDSSDSDGDRDGLPPAATATTERRRREEKGLGC